MALIQVAKAVRPAGSRVQSGAIVVPANINSVKATMIMDAADMTSPDTEVYCGFESSTDDVNWSDVAATGWKGYVGAPTARMPYIELGPDIIARLKASGARVRGYINSVQQSNVSVDIETA